MPDYTRQQLYDLVWSKPTIHVAKKLGISDVALGKTCKRWHVPKPPLGYWARIEAGQKIKRPALPKWEHKWLTTIRIEPSSKQEPEIMSDATTAKMEQEQAEENRIVVPAVLESPHKLVERANRSMSSAKEDGLGLVSPRAERSLDVFCTKATLDRAMRIMDAFLKAVEARGLKVTIGENKYGGSATLIEVDGEKIDMRLHESVKKRSVELTPAQVAENAEHPYWKKHKDKEDYASGLLVMSFESEATYGRHRFAETEKRRLEDRLNSIVAWLYAASEKVKDDRKIRLERERQWAEEERRRQLEAERRRQEEAKIKELNEEVAAWHEAERIRAYVAAVERHAVADGSPIEDGSDLAKWIVWARNRADSVDPLSTVEDE